MTQTTKSAEIIWDRDHGKVNEGYYVRLHHADGQEEDNSLDALTADAARAEVETLYPSFEITRCDEPRQ